jgi:hypothetical protein
LVQTVPLNHHVDFPLELLFRMVYALLCIVHLSYLILFRNDYSFVLFYNDSIQNDSIVLFTILENCCFDYCLFILVIVHYSDTGNLFQVF